MNFAILSVLIAIGLFILYVIIRAEDFAQQGKELHISTKNIVEHVEKLYNDKEYRILEILAKKYLQRVPKHYIVRCYLAKTYFETGKMSLAIFQCLRILKNHGELDDIRLILAHAYRTKKLSLESLKQFEILYKKGNRTIEVLKNMAELFNQVNQYTASIKLYNMLIPLTKDNNEVSDYKQILSSLNEKVGDYAAAFEAYKGHLELDPHDYNSRKKMIQLYVKVENLPRAIFAIEELLEYNIPPEMRLWALELAIKSSRAINEPIKALDFSEALLQCEGCDFLAVKCVMADIYIKLDNLDDAEKILVELNNMYNDNVEVLTRLAKVYEIMGKFPEANEIYNGLLALIPPTEVRRMHGYMSTLYARWGASMLNGSELNDVAESFRYFSTAIQLDVTNPYVHEQLAKANMAIKNYKEAISQLKIAMDYSEEKDCTKYYMPLSICYHNINNAFEEKKTLLQLVKAEPENSEAHWKLAQLFEAQHDVKGAKSSLETTIDLAPNMIEPKYRLALIYEKEGYKEGAIHLYRQILKLNPDDAEVRNNLQTLLSFNDSTTLET